MHKHPILGLNYATVEDVVHAVEQDGKRTDLHAVHAAERFNVRVEDVTREMRNYAKMERHADNYGMGAEAFRQMYAARRK